jgi:hypothetical protein
MCLYSEIVREAQKPLERATLWAGVAWTGPRGSAPWRRGDDGRWVEVDDAHRSSGAPLAQRCAGIETEVDRRGEGGLGRLGDLPRRDEAFEWVGPDRAELSDRRFGPTGRDVVVLVM